MREVIEVMELRLKLKLKCEGCGRKAEYFVESREEVDNSESIDGWELVDDTEICPACAFPPLGGKITCKFCGKKAPAKTAHIHQGLFVGECCWDERLRSTE